MAATTLPGIYTLSELYVGAAFSTVSSSVPTIATIDTFVDTATTTTTKLVRGCNTFTGFGNSRTIEKSEVMGEAGARSYIGQISIDDISIPMDFQPSDPGQALLRDGGTILRGFTLKAIDPGGGIEWYAMNALYFISDDFSPNSKALTNLTLSVTGQMHILADT